RCRNRRSAWGRWSAPRRLAETVPARQTGRHSRQPARAPAARRPRYRLAATGRHNRRCGRADGSSPPTRRRSVPAAPVSRPSAPVRQSAPCLFLARWNDERRGVSPPVQQTGGLTPRRSPAGSRRATHAPVRNAPGQPELQVGRHLERRAPLRTLNLAAADTGHADAHLLDRAADLALDRLQIRFEGTAADAGDLAADAAQVLRLAAPGVVVAEHRLLAAYLTLHAH